MNKNKIRRDIIVDPTISMRNPWSQFLLDTLFVGLGCLLIAISAQITIPLLPVPTTLQDMTIIMLSMLLGAKRSVAMVTSYLALGLFGAPVFAGLMSGPAVFLSPLGGYLFGFVSCGYVAGLLAEKGLARTPVNCFLSGFLALIVLFVVGVSYFAIISSWHEAWVLGFLPFVGTSFLKLLSISILVPAICMKK